MRIYFPEPQSGSTNDKNNDFDENEDEVLVLPQEKKTASAKKFSSNGEILMLHSLLQVEYL